MNKYIIVKMKGITTQNILSEYATAFPKEERYFYTAYIWKTLTYSNKQT